MTLLFGGAGTSPERNIFVKAADRLSRENIKKFFFAERVFNGRSKKIDVEELLLDTSGEIDFITENFNPFGGREEDFDESIRPVEAVKAWEEIDNVERMLTPNSTGRYSPGELSVYVMDDDLQYDMQFGHKRDHYVRAEMRGTLEEDVDRDGIEAICNKYGIENTLDGWNRDFDDVESIDDYTDLADRSYDVGIEQLKEGIMSGEIRDVRYLDSDYDHLSDGELMSTLLGDMMIPEEIKVSEYERQGETLYDIRVWDRDPERGNADLEIRMSTREDVFQPADEDEIYDVELEDT
jgi:hypothetical protein